jgi:hypothetical protein
VNVELAVIADYAATTGDNKLIICGVFDYLAPQGLPYTHPQMALALRVSAHPSESATHHLTVRMVDPDGRSVVPELNGDFELGPPGGPQDRRGLQLVLALQGVEFTVLGPHAVDILLDGRHEETINLDIIAAASLPSP